MKIYLENVSKFAPFIFLSLSKFAPLWYVKCKILCLVIPEQNKYKNTVYRRSLYITECEDSHLWIDKRKYGKNILKNMMSNNCPTSFFNNFFLKNGFIFFIRGYCVHNERFFNAKNPCKMCPNLPHQYFWLGNFWTESRNALKFLIIDF